MNESEIKQKLNMVWLMFNLLEDYFILVQPHVYNDLKQNINRLLAQLRKVNGIAEKIFSPETLDCFDKDKDVLDVLITHELAAHAIGKRDEFLEYIKNFFPNAEYEKDITKKILATIYENDNELAIKDK